MRWRRPTLEIVRSEAFDRAYDLRAESVRVQGSDRARAENARKLARSARGQ